MRQGEIRSSLTTDTWQMPTDAFSAGRAEEAAARRRQIERNTRLSLERNGREDAGGRRRGRPPRLTPDDVATIRRRYDECREPLRVIAADFGVTPSWVCQIGKRKMPAALRASA